MTKLNKIAALNNSDLLNLVMVWVLLSISTPVAEATSIKIDFLEVGFARTDPISVRNCLSDHIHTFYGAQQVRPETTFATLRATPDNLNTGNVLENKSLYWHPTPYNYNPNTGIFTREVMALTSAYYIWRTGATTAFPAGFQMIAGLNPNVPNQFPRAEAGCVGPSPGTRPGCGNRQADLGNSFFPTTACEELEVNMIFPSCWDGVNLDSPDHTTHVAYRINGESPEEGICPPSHPVSIPEIHFFFRIEPYAGGCVTFSDSTGIFHSQYISGWDPAFLQGVLDSCINESFTSSPDAFCENFVTFRDGPRCTGTTCEASNENLIAALRAIQPPPLNTLATVSSEPTDQLTTLPRGVCTGNLIPAGAPAPPTTPAPFPAPVPPSPSPPTNDDEGETDDETDDEDGGEDGGGDVPEVCFPGDAMVSLPNGQLKRMDELKTGDQVVSMIMSEDTGVASMAVAEVVYLPHLANQAKPPFLEMECVVLDSEATADAAAIKTLRATGQHFIYASQSASDIPQAVTAKTIQVGDFLWTATGDGDSSSPSSACEVLSVQTVRDVHSGAYTAFTTTGKLIVDGFVVSSYAQLDRGYFEGQTHEWSHDVAGLLRYVHYWGWSESSVVRTMVETLHWMLV